MPKPIMFDVVPRNAASAAKLPPRKPAPAPTRAAAPQQEEASAAPAREKFVPLRKSRSLGRPSAPLRKRSHKLRNFLIGAALALGAAFGILSYFEKATVTVTTKTASAKLSADFSSQKEKGGDIPYTLMTVTRDATSVVPAATEQNVEKKASGTITVYNDFSATPYRLIKNTRFETAQHLIFKISDTAVVPGKTTVAGKDVPGSITVPVFAESPGAEYNVGYADFTIPGFKGRPEFDAFYARSKTEIKGGFVGKQKVASDADVAAARAALDAKLKSDIEAAAKAETPEQFALLAGAAAIEYSSDDQAATATGVSVTEHATLRAAIFERSALEKLLASKLSIASSTLPAAITNLPSLIFAPKATYAASLASGGAIQFGLSGNPSFQSMIDSDKLAQSLAGTPKSGFSAAIQSYPSIAGAELELLPFWKQDLPADPSRIRIMLSGR